MIFVVLLALIIFGPRRLPEIGREIGKALAELKRASNEFTNQLQDEIELLDVEEQRKKFKDRTDELWKEAQAGFAVTPPAEGGVARTLSAAGVQENDLAAPQESRVAPVAGTPAEVPPAAAEPTQNSGEPHVASVPISEPSAKETNV